MSVFARFRAVSVLVLCSCVIALNGCSRQPTLEGEFSGPGCMGIKLTFTKNGNFILHMPVGSQDFSGTYKLDGDKVLVSPGDKSGTIVMVVKDGAVTFSMPSLLQLGGMTTLRCIRTMKPDALSDDEAKTVLETASENAAHLFTVDYDVVPDEVSKQPKPEGAPARMTEHLEKSYRAWEALGVVAVAPTKTPYCQSAAHRAYCGQVLRELKVSAGPKGTVFVSQTKDNILDVPTGERKDWHISKVSEVAVTSEKRYLVEATHTFVRSPLLQQYMKIMDPTASNVESQQIKSRTVMHWDERSTTWTPLATDAAPADKDFTTHSIDQFTK